jgi:hypothetical protein
MRTYVGTADPLTGRTTVVITERHDQSTSDLLDAVARADKAVINRHGLHASPTGPDPLRRQSTRLHALLDHAEKPLTRPLPHHVVHSPDGFAWGYAGSGPADLSLAILHREIGETIPPRVYLPFRDQVVARLPADGFELPASQVWDWIRDNRNLVDTAVFGATDSHPPPTTPLRQPTAPTGAGLSL